MDIVVKSRHCEIKDRFRQHIVEKLARMEKLDNRVIRIDVEVSREQNPRLAEVAERVELTVHSKGPVIRAEAAAPDKYTALDIAVERLETRLRKVVERRRNHRGGRKPAPIGRVTPPVAEPAPPPSTTGDVPGLANPTGQDSSANIGPIQVEGDGPLVVREKTHHAEPMSLDQALYEMELVGHDFYLFVDGETKQPSVVYRRRGYDYGVIRLAV